MSQNATLCENDNNVCPTPDFTSPEFGCVHSVAYVDFHFTHTVSHQLEKWGKKEYRQKTEEL